MDLAGIGTLLLGIASLITAGVSVWTLRTARSVKSGLDENTTLTSEVHRAVVDDR